MELIFYSNYHCDGLAYIFPLPEGAFIGRPQSTETYTQRQLESKQYLGIYMRSNLLAYDEFQMKIDRGLELVLIHRYGLYQYLDL